VEPDLHSASFEIAAPGAPPVHGRTDLPGPPAAGAGEPPVHARRPGKWLIEWLVVLVVALVLAICVRVFVAQMFYIPSGSMLPTLQIGDRIVVDKLSYHLHGVDRGDVVVFRRPPLEQVDYADLVKRVIGLPGDTVGSVAGKVYVNGRPLNEPWLSNSLPVTSPSPLPNAFSLSHPYTVPAGEYFVMGDNRTNSEDSRYFGPIPGNLIVGKMAFKVWPLDRSAWLVVLSSVAFVVLILLLLALRAPRRPARHGGAPRRGPPAQAGRH
jgi:signal peptidase I